MKTLSLPGIASLALCCAVLTASPAAADTTSSGFELDAFAMPTGVPLYGTVTCTLPGGDIVTFDGTLVTRWTAAGGFVQSLGSAATSGYAAFILPTPDGSGVVFAHSGDFFAGVGGELFRAPLSGVGPVSIVPVDFPYDAVFLADGDLLVSADTVGGATSNDLLRVDLLGQVATPIGQVPGPSGPVALRANGDLYYSPADPAFPAPSGSGRIVYWSAADVAAGTQLSEANWTVWSSGYDPIASLRVDPLKDRVYIAETLYDGTTFALLSARVLRARPNVAKAEVVAVASDPIGGLEFVNTGGGTASFQAYQPGDGWTLKYNSSDFFSSAEHHTIRPLRPTLTASGPGLTGVGAVALTAVDAPANGILYMFFGPQGQMSASEQTYVHPGYLFHTQLAPGSVHRLPFYIPTDATGSGSFTLYNDGGLGGLFGYQFLVGDGAATLLGSTGTVTF